MSQIKYSYDSLDQLRESLLDRSVEKAQEATHAATKREFAHLKGQMEGLRMAAEQLDIYIRCQEMGEPVRRVSAEDMLLGRLGL